MRFPELLLVIILCLLVPAFGLPLSNAGSINDLPYPLVPMTYSHTIKGRNIELNGTIQVCFLYSIIHNFVLTKDKEVVRQLQGIDPDFTLNSTLSDQENFALEPRGKGNVKCGPIHIRLQLVTVFRRRHCISNYYSVRVDGNLQRRT
jgi:hypothetical protein